MKKVKLDTSAGDVFSRVAETAKKKATEENCQVEFEFNGVNCLVNSSTNLDWLYRDYSNSWTIGWKEVGPNCLESYPPELQETFDARTKEREEKQALERAEWEAKDKAEREACEREVKGIELEFKDKAGWDNSREVNNDGYGGAAMDYAEVWAKKMQLRISAGETVAECADYSQLGLGYLGITGFQFSCAVGILTQTWKHGEELRVWHNSKYGHSGKGVVNPAVMTISK